MHAIEILRDTLARSCPGLHKRRLQTLMGPSRRRCMRAAIPYRTWPAP